MIMVLIFLTDNFTGLVIVNHIVCVFFVVYVGRVGTKGQSGS
jgi:hypothetical protein